MIRVQGHAKRIPVRRGSAVLALALAALPHAGAVETKISGRITFGSIHRVQGQDPDLLTAINATAIGLTGYGSGGNADDANTNYRRGDAASRALKGFLDLSAREGDFAALVRVKAWRDFGLLRDERPWGNSANGYAANAPLSDRGAERLTRFSGVALSDAWLQYSMPVGAMRLTGRAGQQSLNWGDRSGTPGGLEALNPRDLPALHRAGAAPQELKVPVPMLFARLDVTPQLGLEAYYQTRFRPTALDMCGTLWSMNDYMAEGCDKVMTGQPQVSDRARVVLGAYQKRLPTVEPRAGEFGVGLTFKSSALATDFGLYHAHYNSRSGMPGIRRSTRVGGPALIAGDPDGRNMAYYIEYPEGLAITALTFAHKRERISVYGELSYRPEAPFMLAPGDVIPPFLNASAPSLLRRRADAVPPGGLFRGFDLYALTQAQLGVQHEWRAAGTAFSASAEVVGKHVSSLPDQAVLRYGRADIMGVGPVNGVCTVSTRLSERQCSLRGYVTTNAWGYRLRLDARLPVLLPQLAASASAIFAHDVKGWSGDFLLQEGRKTANLALRFEYRQRYLAELTYLPSWGGDYSPAADRDTASFAVGVRF